MSTAIEGSGGACLSCGATLSGAYCASCGEKRVGPHDLQLGHLAHDFWHEVTHLDGKIWRTFRALLLQPGLLTKEYWEGRHGRWMRPLRVFLIVTALSLLLVPDAAGPLGMRFYAWQRGNTSGIGIGQRVPEGTAALTPGGDAGPHGMAQASVALGDAMTAEGVQALRTKLQKYYKVFQYLGLAAFAACSMLLLRRAQPYYGGHVIWALHYYSFVYLLTGVIEKTHANPMVGVYAQIVYLNLAMRRLSGGAWWASVLRASALMAVVGISELLILALTGNLASWLH